MSWLSRVRALFSNAKRDVEVLGVSEPGVARPFGPPASVIVEDGTVPIALDHGVEFEWLVVPVEQRVHLIRVGAVPYHHVRDEGRFWIYRPV